MRSQRKMKVHECKTTINGKHKNEKSKFYVSVRPLATSGKQPK